MPELESALLRKLNRFRPLAMGDRAALARIEATNRTVAASTELIHERQTQLRAFILQQGWGYCFKILPDGSRQVIDVRVPGDFMGLRSVLLRTADHSFVSVTDVTVAEFSARQLMDMFEQQPKLGVAFLWAASRDEAMVVEHLVGIGRRNALVRTAHFLVELGLRLELVGLGTASSFACPLNQYVLADVVGLTAIHLNRILRELRERKLLTFRDGYVRFDNLTGLRELAEYDGGYLDQKKTTH